MGKPEWGAKRICPNCGARFYDLLRDPVPCPSCGTAYELESLSERKPAQAVRTKAKPEKAAPVEDSPVDDDEDLLDDDAPDTVSEDVLLAEEDDDDSSDLGDIEVTKDDDDES